MSTLKKIVAIVMFGVMMFETGNNYVSRNRTIVFAKNEKNGNYIISTKDKEKFEDIKNELKENGDLVVTHTKKDEEYIYDEQILIGNLTQKEANELQEEGVNVEVDDKVIANTIPRIAKEREKNDVVNTEYTLPKGAITPSIENSQQEEYADDPYLFKSTSSKASKNTQITPWNVALVKGDISSKKYSGKNVKVAVMDSGIDVHNDLKTKKWVDFSEKVNGFKPLDNTGHGTNVAGVIGAQNNKYGIVGIANKADIYSVKVLNEKNSASISTVVKAIEWCIDNKMDVINMSFGIDRDSATLKKAIKKAYENNIILVASAGNNCEQVQYPAKYKEVISVGSVNKKLKKSNFSSKKNPDVYAPGEGAKTLGYLGSYEDVDGSSMAAAHVSGVAAVMRGKWKHISNKQIYDSIICNSVDVDKDVNCVNLGNALNGVKTKHQLHGMTKKDINKQLEQSLEDEKELVTAQWNSNTWGNEIGKEGTGHKSLINQMSTNYFGKGSESYSEKVRNKSIVARAIELTDSLEWLSATDELGNKERLSSGQIDYGSSKYCHSPYHAKSQYTLNETVEHLKYLYELSRRRLVLNSPLNLKATEYSYTNSYYGVTIDKKIKRRMIVDLSAVYDHLSVWFSNEFSMDTTERKGYMVLGVFLHLVQDMQAHRAIVTKNMLYCNNDGTVFHGYDTFTDSGTASTIDLSNIAGVKEGKGDWSYYNLLFNKINENGGIPIIRLKDVYKSNFYISLSKVPVSASQAYEDNPYFYRDRFTTAIIFSEAYITTMREDTGSTMGFKYYYADERVPLFVGKMNSFKL